MDFLLTVCSKDCSPAPKNPPPNTAPVATTAGAAEPAVPTVTAMPPIIIPNDKATIIHLCLILIGIRRVYNIELHIARERDKLATHFKKWEKLVAALNT